MELYNFYSCRLVPTWCSSIMQLGTDTATIERQLEDLAGLSVPRGLVLPQDPLIPLVSHMSIALSVKEAAATSPHRF